MPTTDPVIIPFEGDPRDFIADAKKVQQEMDILAHRLEKAGVSQAAYNKAVSNSRGAMQGQTEGVKKATVSITDFRSAYMIALDAVRVGQQVWQNTGAEYIKYADSVRDVSRSLGSTTEEASRLIQAADDVFISYDKLTIAMKMAQKQGIDPSIEGLARLSDTYLKLAPGVERTQFLLKTFGKSGAEMGKLMEKGGDGIRKMSAGIEDNLILTKKATDEALKFKQAQDKLNDSIDGLKIATGGVIVPFMDAFVRMATVNIQAITGLSGAIEKAVKGGGFTSLSKWAEDIVRENPISLFGITLGGTGEKLDDVAQSAQDAAQGTDTFNESASKVNPALEAANKALDDYKNMLDEVSQANQDAESFIQSYADFQKGYAEDHKQALEDVTDAQEKLQEAYAKEAKTKDQKDNRLEAIKDAKDGLLEAGEAVQKLEATWHESTQKMIYDMVLAKVSADGLTDAEFKATQDLAVSMGIRSQADADAAKAAMDKASAIAEGIAMQEDVLRDNTATSAELLRLEDAKAAASAETTNTVVEGAAVEVNAMGQVQGSVDSATQSLIAMGYAASQTANMVGGISYGGGVSMANIPSPKGASKKPAKIGRGVDSMRDSGGSGIAGVPYGIGVPEVYVPKTGGDFIPLHGAENKIGSTYNVIINNPKKETAENSIRAALKNLSYLGTAS